MNINALLHAVSVSTNKPDCLTAMGLEHSSANFIAMTKTMQKNDIDISHFRGIKASEYVQSLKS